MKIVDHVPMFVTAKTKQALVRKMLKINIKDQYSYRFFDIQYDPSKKEWVAWYYPEKTRLGE